MARIDIRIIAHMCGFNLQEENGKFRRVAGRAEDSLRFNLQEENGKEFDQILLDDFVDSVSISKRRMESYGRCQGVSRGVLRFNLQEENGKKMIIKQAKSGNFCFNLQEENGKPSFMMTEKGAECVSISKRRMERGETEDKCDDTDTFQSPRGEWKGDRNSDRNTHRNIVSISKRRMESF